MKITTAIIGKDEVIGIINEDKFIPFYKCGILAPTVSDLIENYSLEKLLSIEDKLSHEQGYFLSNIRLISPIPHPKQDVICLGLNYLEHAKESSKYKKEKFNRSNNPVYFSKRASQTIGNMEYIDGHFDIVDSLDYEVELAVIMDKDAYKVDTKEALDSVFGYTIINDVSARNIQSNHKQWYLGKSLDTFCPVGPYIVTKDEIDDPQNLYIRSYVNDELRQDANTRNMIFDIPYIISNLSKAMTIKSASIISTGTPKGVGMGFIPPKFLKSGDKITCEIEKIGQLVNFIK